LCWSSKHFGRKNLIKSSDLHCRQGNLLHTKEHFYRVQQNLSLQHKIGWRPAEKKSPFFQHASSSTKISMRSTSTCLVGPTDAGVADLRLARHVERQLCRIHPSRRPPGSALWEFSGRWLVLMRGPFLLGLGRAFTK
jgi:hypothetical protein